MFISKLYKPTPQFLKLINFRMTSVHFSNMNTNESDLKENTKTIFLNSLHSVAPQTLIKNILRRENDSLFINNREYKLKENLYLIGFGKAVLGMACEVVQMTRDHMHRGILSIPAGLISPAEDRFLRDGNVEIYEGSAKNIPNEKSMHAAIEAKELVKNLNENHLLLALISGGGSALLPFPVPPISLKEKADLIQQLSELGASIMELNTVRKKISILKGGGLARLASPAQTVSLILSDVIGDPIDFIASGPTIENKDEELSALNIVKKYGMLDKVPHSIKTVLQRVDATTLQAIIPKPENIIIGNNKMALNAAAKKAECLGFIPVILSDSIQGNIIDVCSFYTSLIKIYIECAQNKISPSKVITTLENQNVLPLPCGKLWLDEKLLNESVKAMQTGVGICFIAGGEPTVVVLGKGRGGRNQELALRMAIALHNFQCEFNDYKICFLSAGTDGIDSHTDAAGAVAYPELINEALEQKLNADSFIKCNDSFTFYSELQNGQNLIYTGHTGTNVMDIHILIIKM